MPLSLPDVSLAVVGADFPNAKGPTRRFELAMCHRGEPVELRPEPKNPVDPNAVAVYSCRGVQIGYLSAERAQRMTQIINQEIDVRAVFQELAPWGAYIRVAFDSSTLDLPAPADRDRSDESYQAWGSDDAVDWIPPDD